MNRIALLALAVATTAACTGLTGPTHEDMVGAYAIQWTCDTATCGAQPPFSWVRIEQSGDAMTLEFSGLATLTFAGSATFDDGDPCVLVPAAGSTAAYQMCMRDLGAVSAEIELADGRWTVAGDLQ